MTISPPPGWYPSPDGDPAWQRYWDGSSWTPHRVPSQPSAMPVALLAPSGLRKVEGVFDDGFRIIRKAWLPIIGIGLACWLLWALIAALIASVVGVPRALRELGDGSGELVGGAGVLGGAAAAILLAALVAAAVHSAAALRLGAEAAAGREPTFAVGWRGAATGAPRLLGYGLLFAGAASLVVGLTVWQLAEAFLRDAPALGLLIGLVGFLILAGLALFAIGRFSPALVQATVGEGGLSWSWHATSGKFWAVLGRYLLWSVIASAAINAITSVLWVPSSAPLGAGASGVPTMTELGLLLALVAGIASAAINVFSMLGAVPIWRDLTHDPAYRSIDETGTLVRR